MKTCPFCAEEIQDEALVCKHCGREIAIARPSYFFSNAIKIGLGVGALIIGSWFINNLDNMDRASDTGRLSSWGNPTSGPDNYVTMSEFNQIREGMTYQQVSFIVGHAGELETSSRFGDLETQLYRWSNSDFSSMSAIFTNGALTMKSQFNLR